VVGATSSEGIPSFENLYFTTVGSTQYKQYNNRIREEQQLI